MPSVSPEIKRGSAELAVLSVHAAHGYELAKRIERQAGGVLGFDMASLYPMLYRLEKRGWIKGAWETVSGGRRRRCYTLTSSGRKKLAPLRAEWRLFFGALEQLAGVPITRRLGASCGAAEVLHA